MNGLLRIPVFLALALSFAAALPAADRDGGFRDVELDRLIEREKDAVEKLQKKKIVMAAPVRFFARMKRRPEEKKMTYVYTALEVAGVKPMPEVGHRMFVETEEGRIIPVYVEKEAAARLMKGLEEGERARFLGYHIYSYDKGPAILVVDFASDE
jgi:hypothetical protein